MQVCLYTALPYARYRRIQSISLSAWSDTKFYYINNIIVQTKWIYGDNEFRQSARTFMGFDAIEINTDSQMKFCIQVTFIIIWLFAGSVIQFEHFGATIRFLSIEFFSFFHFHVLWIRCERNNSFKKNSNPLHGKDIEKISYHIRWFYIQ